MSLEQQIKEALSKGQIIVPEQFIKGPEQGQRGQAVTQANSIQNNTHSQSPILNKNMDTVCIPVKTFTKDVDIDSGAAAGTREFTLNYGSDAKRIKGLYIIASSLGGLTASQVKVGFGTPSASMIDPTMLEHWQVSTSVEIKKRFFHEDIDLNGSSLKVTVVTAAATSSAFELQVIALVERNK